MIRLVAILLFFTVRSLFSADLQKEDSVVLFPTMAYPVDEGREWEVNIHGWVFRPKPRELTLSVLEFSLGLNIEKKASEKALFEERARLFLADSKRGRQITVRLGKQSATLYKSASNGHFYGILRLTDKQMRELQNAVGGASPSLDLALFQDNREVGFPKIIYPINETGLSVISDIDDTIKVTEILDKKAMLRNTFCRPFRAVEDMADVYRHWAEKYNARFHYVSASPWQLQPLLGQFLRDNQFPEGTFHCKLFRVKDESFFQLFDSPGEHKNSVIEPMLERFPKRKFILVGDSGEKDPEIYGALARKHPSQIQQIFIREVPDSETSPERYQKAFEQLPSSLWKVFINPSEIEFGIKKDY